MTIGTLMHAKLVASGGVSQRVYPLKLPQSPTYPAISYQRVSNTGTNGSTPLRQTRYQINCWASTYAGTQTIAAAIKTAFEEYTEGAIKMSLVVNEIDDYEDEVDVYRTIIDVILDTTGD